MASEPKNTVRFLILTYKALFQGQPKTPERPIQILKGEIAHIDCVRYQCECPDYHENGYPVGKEVRGEVEYQVADKELGYSQCWLFARRLGWRFQDRFCYFKGINPSGECHV
jgi:hypothetical protein